MSVGEMRDDAINDDGSDENDEHTKDDSADVLRYKELHSSC